MTSSKRHSHWVWISTLWIAEEIPTAVVTYVAVLMFLQFGASIELASVYSGLLFLPWVMKSYFRLKVRSLGHFKTFLHVAEGLLFACLMGIALYINDVGVHTSWLFVLLFLLSLLCAWHNLLTRMYYNRMLYPRQQSVLDKIRMFVSQSTIILTYGVLIIVAGFFEVFFRSYQKAWAMESYLVAGVFMLMCVCNLAVIVNPRTHNPNRYESLIHAFKNEMHFVDRVRQKKGFFRMMVSLFFLLLPQALMFNSRVFFLLSAAEEGGLECSMQDIGFAQGTVGVIAFSIGALLGRLALRRVGAKRMFGFMVFCLTLSPVFYMLMSHNPLIDNIVALCSMTFFAQLLFGFGLNVCLLFVRFVSGERYDSTINFLFVPLVASVMFLPMMASGWLVTLLGFEHFFVANTLCAPVAWLVLLCLRTKKILFPSMNLEKK